MGGKDTHEQTVDGQLDLRIDGRLKEAVDDLHDLEVYLQHVTISQPHWKGG
jgi:hypothetical protein